MCHGQTISDLTSATFEQSGVRGLFLSGSHGRELADAHSDIDLVAVVDEGAILTFVENWPLTLRKVGRLLLLRHRRADGELINAIIGDWCRVDVEVFSPTEFKGRSRNGLKALFDPNGWLGLLPIKEPEQKFDSSKFAWQVDEFFKILGLLVLAVGREEWINGVTGGFQLRQLLIDLLILEADIRDGGGKLHMNRLLTAEQREAIEALPPLDHDCRSLIEAYVALAKAYIPRARAFARLHNIQWPTEFEEATWSHLERSLHIHRPNGEP